MTLKGAIFRSILIFNILATIFSCNSQAMSDKQEESIDLISKGTIVSELGKKISIIFQDVKNNYWFASGDQGVYRYDGENLVLYTKEDGLSSNTIIGIQEDKAGNIYFDNEEAVDKFDGEQFTPLTIAAPAPSQNNWKLEPGDLWFKMGFNQKGPFRYDGEVLHPLKFPKNDLEDEFYKQYPNVSFSPYGIYTMYADSKGSIWFGTASLGVCRYDGKSFHWIYEEQLSKTPGGGDFGFRSIIEDKEGYYWFCNTRYRYEILPDNPSSPGKFNYRREEGLVNSNQENSIDVPYFLSITSDDKGDLWGVTYKDGVYMNNGEELIHYPVQDGDRRVLLFTIYKDNQGVLWLGSHNAGAFRFNGMAFEKFRI